jgi:hypothetical protein
MEGLTHSVGWIISNPGAALFARPPPHLSIALLSSLLAKNKEMPFFLASYLLT